MKLPTRRTEPPRAPIAEAVQAQIRALLDEGYAPRAIADVCHVSPMTVQRYRDAWGIPARASYRKTPFSWGKQPMRPAVCAHGQRLYAWHFVTDALGRVVERCGCRT